MTAKEITEFITEDELQLMVCAFVFSMRSLASAEDAGIDMKGMTNQFPYDYKAAQQLSTAIQNLLS